MSLVFEHAFSRMGGKRSPLAGLVSWFRTGVRTFKANRQRREEISYLRCLDGHLLRDMGVDVAELGKASPKLAGFHPQVTAMNLLIDAKSLIPPNTSSR